MCVCMWVCVVGVRAGLSIDSSSTFNQDWHKKGVFTLYRGTTHPPWIFHDIQLLYYLFTLSLSLSSWWHLLYILSAWPWPCVSLSRMYYYQYLLSFRLFHDSLHPPNISCTTEFIIILLTDFILYIPIAICISSSYSFLLLLWLFVLNYSLIIRLEFGFGEDKQLLFGIWIWNWNAI